jgi:hypothetical protein
VEKLHNEELNDLYSSPNIVRVIQSKIIRWAGHVARFGKKRGVYRFLGIDGRIILKWILRKWNVGVWTGSSWGRIVTGGGHL